MRRASLCYLIACAIAALVPFLSVHSEQPPPNAIVFSGWPNQFEGKTLTALPMTELEQRFMSDFPGKIGRFTDGEREIVIRWVTEATRKLHPASDCFQGLVTVSNHSLCTAMTAVRYGPASRRAGETIGCVFMKGFIASLVRVGRMCLRGTGWHCARTDHGGRSQLLRRSGDLCNL